jgi:hypothetical protein
MVYVPALDLYIDPTGGYAPVGTLPREAMAKTVLHLRDGRLGRTPVMDPRTDFSETHVELVLDEDGGVRGKSTMRISGAQEASSRPEVSMAISDGIGAHIARQFQTDSEPRTVEIDAQPELLDRPWVIRLSFRLEGLVALPGPATLTLPLALAPGQPEGPGQARGRLRAFLCDGARHDETMVIHLPPAVRVRRVPEAVEFKRGRLAYRASYSLRDSALVVRRRFVSGWPGPVCPPQAGEEWMVIAEMAAHEAEVTVGLTQYSTWPAVGLGVLAPARDLDQRAHMLLCEDRSPWRGGLISGLSRCRRDP